MAPDFPRFILGVAVLTMVAAPAASQDVAPAISLSTDLGDAALQAGVSRSFSVAVTNLRDAPLPVRVAVEGAAAALAGPSLQLTLAPNEQREIALPLGSSRPGLYLGTLVAEAGNERREVPFQILVRASAAGPPVVLEVGPLRVKPGETFSVNVSPRAPPPLQGVLRVRTEDGTLLFQESVDFSAPRNLTFKVPAGTAPGDITVEAAIPDIGSALRSVTVLPAPFPTYLLLLPAAAAAGVVLLQWRRELQALLVGRRRYPPLTAYGSLPKGPLAVGRVAGSRRRFELGAEHLQGHVLVAGATGGGKSVAAMVLAEEALRQKWSVVVCDPTTQWSGLLRPCRDRNLLRRYKPFGLGEPAGWAGTRRGTPEFEDRDLVPGRMLLFDFRENHDESLARLMDRLRAMGNPKVPLMVVLEEIHRALPKYGAPDQLYPLLESMVREFRHRSIALVMTSQLLSDFSPEISDNILTELQMLTKGPEDLARLERKYGADAARLATRLEPGAGLLHHPGINGGRPVAVEIRPTLGDPHKLPGPLLDRWRDLWTRYWRLAESASQPSRPKEERASDAVGRPPAVSLRDAAAGKALGPDAVQALARARERLDTFRLEMAQVYLDEAVAGRGEGGSAPGGVASNTAPPVHRPALPPSPGKSRKQD